MLGELTPEDVDVQMVYGRVGAEDELRDPMVTSLQHVEENEDGRHRFEAEVSLEDTGAFGYTVRLCPHHELLASAADLGLVVWPPDVNLDDAD